MTHPIILFDVQFTVFIQYKSSEKDKNSINKFEIIIFNIIKNISKQPQDGVVNKLILNKLI